MFFEDEINVKISKRIYVIYYAGLKMKRNVNKFFYLLRVSGKIRKISRRIRCPVKFVGPFQVAFVEDQSSFRLLCFLQRTMEYLENEHLELMKHCASFQSQQRQRRRDLVCCFCSSFFHSSECEVSYQAESIGFDSEKAVNHLEDLH